MPTQCPVGPAGALEATIRQACGEVESKPHRYLKCYTLLVSFLIKSLPLTPTLYIRNTQEIRKLWDRRQRPYKKSVGMQLWSLTLEC